MAVEMEILGTKVTAAATAVTVTMVEGIKKSLYSRTVTVTPAVILISMTTLTCERVHT
jgi:hypothetical protein